MQRPTTTRMHTSERNGDMFSIEIDRKNRNVPYRYAAHQYIVSANYSDEMAARALDIAEEQGSTDVLSHFSDSAGESHTVSIRYGY